MIIDNKQSDVTVVGDIREFKTGIDPKNLEFITTLLSSNLYSNPEQSFMREIVSNAWDSHVEAGNTDTPVIIQITDSSVAIRDYGIGLSPERFKEVYCNIGSSTKRDTNDFIGGFGIGKYSSLACSNTAYITSYYKGKKYFYIMVKSGNAITTNLVSVTDTEEKDGVEVKISNLNDIKPYIRGLRYLVFFPNIYIDKKVSCYVCDFVNINGTKIKKYNNYAAADIEIPDKILLGNVLYPLNNKHFTTEELEFLNKINYTGIVLKFEVGDLNITPNRESIIYTSDTINKIKDKIAKCKEELYSNISKLVEKDYDNIFEYYKVFEYTRKYDPIKNIISENNTYYNFNFSISDLNTKNVTYKGKDLSNNIKDIQRLCLSRIPDKYYKGLVLDTRVITSYNLPYNQQDTQKFKYFQFIGVNEKFRFLAPIKLYLREYYENYTVIYLPEYDEFKKCFKNYDIPDESLIKNFYEDFKSKVEFIDFNTDKNFLDYKEALSKDNSSVTSTEPLYLYEYTYSNYYNRTEYTNYNDIVKYIKGFKKGIVLSYIDSNNNGLSSYLYSKGYILFTAKKSIMDNLMKEDFKNRIDLNYILYKDPYLKELSSVLKCAKGVGAGVYVSDWECVKDTVPNPIKTEITNMLNSWQKNSNYFFINHVKNLDLPMDPYIELLFNKMKFYINTYNNTHNEVSENGIISDLITETLIIKRGAYRVSYRTYRKYKNNKIIQTLCKK